MGDSDDDYDRRRRDKFRGERTGGDNMRARREDMYDRAGPARSRGDYRVDAYRSGGGRDSRGYSPPNHLSRDLSPPPHKRVRADWSGGPDRRYPAGYSAGDSYPVASSNGSSGYGASGYSADSDNPTQPPMMTFKAFLASQDDMITDDEAIKKYTEYKLDFRRQQLSNFFLAHKEEEWFKAKYHPDDHSKKQEEHTNNLKRRIEVFLESLEGVDKVALDGDNASAILRLLDSVVIRLENGTALDLTVLDLPDDDEPEKSDEKPFILDAKKNRDDANKNSEDLSQMEMTEEQKQLQQKAKEFLKKKEESKKRKYTSGSSSGSSSSSDSSSDSEDDGAGKAAKAGKARKQNQPAPPGENGDRPLTPPAIKLPVEEPAAGDGDKPLEPTEAEVKVEAEATTEKDDEDKTTATDSAKKTAASDVQPPKPRPLHKTASIFLRNLAPTITKQEVEAMCRRYPGFLRAAIADPQPDRRWFRRGWVTFERHVNIKEICWNLNNIRLRDCELGAIVNRDLSRRVRTVNGVTSHRTVVRADIKLSARIIQNLDSRHRLWCQPAADTKDQREQGETGDEQEQTYGVTSQNPILRNITDYLIEEASAEEEELLGVNVSSACPEEAAGAGASGNGTAPAADTVERDEALIKVLDKLLLYLRVVHSVDYYNHSEYPNEDEMPNRCGIIHTRGIPPTSKVTANETQDYTKSFGNKIGSFLQPLPRLSEDDCKKNGLVLKDPEEETEKFVQANTQELSKDKWLCPLSNKKFKGPDFVRKHIFNKHAEKVEEVKKEVEFFNNYLRDPKRPQLLEHPSKGAPAASGSNSSSSSRRGEEPPAQFHVGPYPQPAPPPPHPSYGGAYGGPYQRGPMYGGYQAAPPRDPYYREPYLPPRDAYPRPPRPYGRRSAGVAMSVRFRALRPPFLCYPPYQHDDCTESATTASSSSAAAAHHQYNRPLNSYRDLDAPKEVEEF